VPHNSILVRVFPNGDIMFSQRLTTSIRCKDTGEAGSGEVTCEIHTGPYAVTDEDVVVTWRQAMPIQLVNSQSSGVVIKDAVTSTSFQVAITGRFSMAEVKLILQRNQCGH